MKVYLKTGKVWDFKWDKDYEGLIHKTKHNIYRIFVDKGNSNNNEGAFNIWIGRQFDMPNGEKDWITWGDELKVDYINFSKGNVVFK